MTWIHTRTGKAVDLLNPQPDQICIADIAHSLAHQCRYTGHASRFYSVAEHSVLVADALMAETKSRELAWAGLMHDAHEAYTGDVASPIKVVLGDSWRAFEERMERAVRARYEVPTDGRVKDMDLRALLAEREQVLPWPPPRPWGLTGEKPMHATLQFWTPREAEEAFLLVARAYAPTLAVWEEIVTTRNA